MPGANLKRASKELLTNFSRFFSSLLYFRKRYQQIYVVPILLFALEAGAAESYGTYGLFPNGPNRVTAMGGAYTALSDDASGIVYNPAGLAFQPYWGDAGGNFNVVQNLEADLDGNGVKDGIPYAYAYYAGSLKLGNWGFGAGISSPYIADLSFDGRQGSFTETRNLFLSIVSLDIPVAYRLSEQWSVGINFQAQTLEQRYSFKSTDPASIPIKVAAKKDSGFMALGLMYRPYTHWGFGVSAYPPKKFEITNEASLNAQTGGVQWFRSVVIPAKFSLGTFYQPTPYLVLAADVDVFEKVENAVYVGSELVPGFRKVRVEAAQKTVFHGGLEWNFIATKFWDFYLRFGTYNEPNRLEGGSARQHVTAGLAIRYWVFSLSASVDGADQFANAASGIGLSLKFYL